jgi:hypothetical protein
VKKGEEEGVRVMGDDSKVKRVDLSLIAALRMDST